MEPIPLQDAGNEPQDAIVPFSVSDVSHVSEAVSAYTASAAEVPVGPEVQEETMSPPPAPQPDKRARTDLPLPGYQQQGDPLTEALGRVMDEAANEPADPPVGGLPHASGPPRSYGPIPTEHPRGVGHRDIGAELHGLPYAPRPSRKSPSPRGAPVPTGASSSSSGNVAPSVQPTMSPDQMMLELAEYRSELDGAHALEERARRATADAVRREEAAHQWEQDRTRGSQDYENRVYQQYLL